MIDIENEVYHSVYAAIMAAHPGVTMKGVPESTPAKFPFVSLEQKTNADHLPTRDSSGLQNHANQMFQLDIYTNDITSKKATAKAIAQTADKVLVGMGFRCVSSQPTGNLGDSTIYRITARYEAVVSKNNTIYWR